MFEDEPWTPGDEHAPEVTLPTLGDGDGATSDGNQPARAGWRTRSKVIGALASVVVLAVAVIVPMELSGIETVSGAVKGVFAEPTVRFVLTEQGTPQLSGYSVALTISNPSGAAVSAPKAKKSYEISVLHDGTDLADVMVTHTAIFLHLDVDGIDAVVHQQGGVGSLRHYLLHAAKGHPQLAYLRVVANGGWIGLDVSQLKAYLTKTVGKLAPPGGLSSKSAQIRSALTLSFAQAWDAWASLHVQSSSGGVTEYSIKLPVRQFLLTFAKRFERRIQSAFPELAPSFPAVNGAIGHIPAALRLPIDLWVRNGTLTRVAVTYHGITLDVRISHPAALPSAPSGVTYLTIADLKAFIKYVDHPTVPVLAAGNAVAESNAQTALVVAATYYTKNNHSFSGLTRLSPNSVGRFDTGLTWIGAGKIPRTATDISSEVGSSGQSVVLTSYDPSARTCAGIVEIRAAVAHPVFGVRTIGTYFFLHRHDPAAACEVTRLTHVKLSREGFPGMAVAGSGSGISSILAGIGFVGSSESISGSSGFATSLGGFGSGSSGSSTVITTVPSSASAS